MFPTLVWEYKAKHSGSRMIIQLTSGADFSKYTDAFFLLKGLL